MYADIFVGLILMLWHRETHISPRRNRLIMMDPAGTELTTPRLRQLRQLPVVHCQLKFNICVRCDMAFIEPMHRNKPNITYLLTSCPARSLHAAEIVSKQKLELDSPSLRSPSIQPTRLHCQLAFAPGSTDIHVCCCQFRCPRTGKRYSNRKVTSCLPVMNAGFEPRVSDTISPAD